jgi:hypothetical protein
MLSHLKQLSLQQHINAICKLIGWLYTPVPNIPKLVWDSNICTYVRAPTIAGEADVNLSITIFFNLVLENEKRNTWYHGLQNYIAVL